MNVSLQVGVNCSAPLRAAMDVLDLARELAPLVSDDDKAAELASRVETLDELIRKHIKVSA